MLKQISQTFCRHFPLFQALAVNSGMTPLCSNPPKPDLYLMEVVNLPQMVVRKQLTQMWIFKVMALTYTMKGQ